MSASPFVRLCAGLLLVVALGGCSAALPEAARQLKSLSERLIPTADARPEDARHLDAAYEALAEGNYHRAETHLDYALAINPDNPFALLNLGVVYQNTERADEARAVYQRLIALEAGARAVSATRLDYVGKTVAEIAEANLERLDGAGAAGLPRPPAGGDEAAAIARFQTLARLHQAGLVSDEEYASRRAANLGALLPRTGPAPAPGLERPAPPAEDIAERLRTIASFRDVGALSEAEYREERAAILDALMPAGGAAAPQAPPPPDPERELARLGHLAALGLISDAERARESAAVTGQPVAEAAPPPSEPTAPSEPAAPPAAPPSSATGTAAPSPAAALEAIAPAAGGFGLHLASTRTPKRAERRWRALAAAHGEALAGLAPRIERVDLGPETGVFYRLLAGPLADPSAAEERCQRLARAALYCKPTGF